MHFLFNTRTNEKIMLNKDVYSIGTFPDSDTRLNCPGKIQIIIKKKRGDVILYKGCGKFQVNHKHTLKKVLEDNDEIFIGKEVFVFTLKPEFDMKKSQIIYNSYLASMDSISNEEDSMPGLRPDKPVHHLQQEKILENKLLRQSELLSYNPVGRKPEPPPPQSKPARPSHHEEENKALNELMGLTENLHRKPAPGQASQPQSRQDSGSQSISELLALNESYTKQFSPISEFDSLLPLIAELPLQNIKADKALLMLVDEESKQLSVKTAVNFPQTIEELDKLAEKINREVITSLKSNTACINSISIPGANFIDSLLVARLSANNTVYGYICLINKIFGEFNNNDKYIMELLATQASLAIERINLYNSARYETDVIGKLRKYLPTKTISRLIESNANLSLNGESETGTVLFVDICNFTAISDSLTPQQTVSFLNEFFTVMTKIIMTYNGNVNKFIGDGILAVFGTPVKNNSHALEASLAALEMKKQKALLTKKFMEKFGINYFNFRIGISSGPITYGNVGSLQRMDFTLIGETVHIASILETNAPMGGILVNRSTYENIYAKIKVNPAPKIRVKGRSEQLDAYELVERIDEGDIISHRDINSKIDYSVREHVRVAVKAMAIVLKNGKPVQGLLKDISVGGVCLSLSMSGTYKVEEEISLSFKLNEQINFLNVSGVIKHIKKSNSSNGSARQVMGIMFSNLPPDDFNKLNDYIEKKCLNWQQLPLE
jgi:class 3 adenylate cyclase